MKTKKMIAMGLAAVMFLIPTGTNVMAEEEIAFEDFNNDAEFCDEETFEYEEEFLTVADEPEEEDVLFADDALEETVADLIAADDFDDEFAEAFDEDIEIEELFSPADEQGAWKMLFTETNGVQRQVIIFEQEDGSWTDVQGHIFTKNEDGTWTDADGKVYKEVEEDGSGLFEEDDIIVDEEDDAFSDNRSGDKAVNSFVSGSKKTAQSIINGLLDVISKTDSDMIPIMGMLKTIVGEMFALNSSSDPNKVVLEKLNEIEAQLKDMESRLKEHMENVVAFDSIGGEFQKVADSIAPLECKIGDLTRCYQKGKIDKDQLNEGLAALYSMGEYNSLMQALSGATNAYGGKTSFTLDQRSIFGAAYMLQCDKVMFSGEAIDCVTPYLLRQLTLYLKGYTLINIVLDAYEAVNGEDATLQTRENMFRNLGGIVDGKFNEKEPGVFGLYSEFFNTYRYTFVNKSSNKANHVRLGSNLNAVFGLSETFLGNGSGFSYEGAKNCTPEVISKCPLSAEQVKAIADYAAAKNKTMLDFLTDTAGFRLKLIPTGTLMKYFGLHFYSATLESEITVPFIGTVTLNDVLKKGATYMPAGAQYFTYEYAPVQCGKTAEANYMNAISAAKVGPSTERLKVADSYDAEWKTLAVNPNMVFFTW